MNVKETFRPSKYFFSYKCNYCTRFMYEFIFSFGIVLNFVRTEKQNKELLENHRSKNPRINCKEQLVALSA